MLVSFQCRGVLLIWIIVGGAGGDCLDICSLYYFFLSPSFSLSPEGGPKILSQRAVKPVTTNQKLIILFRL